MTRRKGLNKKKRPTGMSWKTPMRRDGNQRALKRQEISGRTEPSRGDCLVGTQKFILEATVYYLYFVMCNFT